MPQVIPPQDTYISPFSEDTPLGLGKFLEIYNIFMKIGDAGYHGFNSSRITSFSNTLPNISARVYDTHGIDFSGSWSSGSPNQVTLNGGSVVVNNTLIELEGFTTIFNEYASHWAPGNIYNTWSFTQSATSSAFMCVLFDPYNEDGSVNSDEPQAKIIYARESEIDYSIMAPIWIVRVTKSGSTVTNMELLLEASGVTKKIEQIGFWKNIALDGGDLD